MSERPSGGDEGQHLDEDRCLDLLNDLLSPDEKQRALAHMKRCPECEEFVRARVSEMEKSRSQINDVRGRLEAVIGRETRSEGSWFDRFFEGLRRAYGHRPLRIASGLVVAVLALLLFVPLSRKTAREPRLTVLPDIPADLRFRSGEETSPADQFLAGLTAYNKRDFSRAAALLSEAEVTDVYATFKKVYLGSALAWDGKYKEAVSVLQPVSNETIPEPWGSGFRWTYFVALYKTGESAAADSLANILAGEAGEIGERARQYLRLD